MFVAPPIRVPTDADSEMMKAKQAEMQAALERVRDVAESWFGLSEDERDRLREEWSERGSPATRGIADKLHSSAIRQTAALKLRRASPARPSSCRRE